MQVILCKDPTGFGFSIIGGDESGEMLRIGKIIKGRIAEKSGKLKEGDVLVRINGQNVLKYKHQEIVSLLQQIRLYSPVRFEICRNISLLESVKEKPLKIDSKSKHDEVISPPSATCTWKLVHISKGPFGFGFSIGKNFFTHVHTSTYHPILYIQSDHTEQGLVVKRILNKAHCSELRAGDLIVEVNRRKYSNKDLLTFLKNCPTGKFVTILIMRS